MKRYIRLKNGKILEDAEKRFPDYDENGNMRLGYRELSWDTLGWFIENAGGIVAESDTFEDLIADNDLIGFTTGIILQNRSTRYLDLKNMTELYTKNKNDYILVARKIKNEWKIIL